MCEWWKLHGTVATSHENQRRPRRYEAAKKIFVYTGFFVRLRTFVPSWVRRVFDGGSVRMRERWKLPA
jgi:hypothetical protein